MLGVPAVSSPKPSNLSVVVVCAALAGCGARLESRIEDARRLEARYIAGQGHARAERGELGGAAAAYATALASDPRLVTLYFHLGYAYERLGSAQRGEPAREEALRRAAVCYRLAADSEPERRRHALLRLAGVHGPAGLGELGLLEGVLAELVGLDPPEADLFLALARLREERQRLDEAEAALLAARDALPHAAAVHMELARFYRRHERLDAFFAALERRLGADPDDREALYALIEGCFYRAFRDYPIGADRRRVYVRRGIVAAERLMRLEPDHAGARRYRDLLSRLRAEMDAGRDPHS